MKRPSFQFYPGDWMRNPKLRRCSQAARAVWMDVICMLHDSEEYGLVRWPLAELAAAVGADIALLQELASKGVLKGADGNCAAYIYTPRSGNKDGDPVTLIEMSADPCWYSSRLVRDEYVRCHRGGKTRFTEGNQPSPTGSPMGGIGFEHDEDDGGSISPKAKPAGEPKGTPKVGIGEKSSPMGGIGDPVGDGSSTSTSSSASLTTSTVEPKGSTGAAGAGAGVVRLQDAGNADPGKPDWWPQRDRYGRITTEITEKLAFDVGKSVLGSGAGGQVTKMRKAFNGDWRAVVDFLLQSDEKSDPNEWFAGVLRRKEMDIHPIPVPKHEIYPAETHR